jgi:hypothetical protein
MSRTSKITKASSGLILLSICFIAGSGYVLSRNKSADSTLRTIERLDPNLYYENANSLRGNTYRIDAEIDSSLGSPPSSGRFFSVVVKDARENGPVILPVLIPPSLGSLTIEKGQHYYLKVKVDERGMLIAEEAVKP